MEQKADRKIRGMEREQKKLAYLMGVKDVIGEQRTRKGGWI